MMAAWGLVTLILFFTVLLLANELLKVGKSPLDIAKELEPETTITPQTVAAGSELKNVPVYLAAPDGRMLVAEYRTIPFGEFTVDNCRAALDELKKTGPGKNRPLLPQAVDYNALYLVNGELIIDFTTQLGATGARSVGAEALLVYGVVNTVTQRELQGAQGGEVAKVRFLIGGSAPTEQNFAHIDLSQPLSPDPQWILNIEAAPESNG